MRIFPQAIEPAAAPQKPAGIEKQFLHTFTAGALLPFTQATITALLIFTGTFVIAWIVFDMIDPVKPAIIFAVIAWVVTWLTRQRLWISLAMFERVTGIDLNQDGVIGDEQEPPQPTVIRIDDVKTNGHYQSNTYSLPASEEQLIRLAHGLINQGKSLSRREWTTRSNVFSDSEWRALQSEMIKCGLIELPNDRSRPNAGYELTRSGRALMDHYAALSSPTAIGEVVDR